MGVGSASVIGQPPETEYRGMKEFFAFLDFINDKDMLKREVARLEKRRSEANAAVALVGKAAEIGGLHVKAAEALKKARGKLALAETEITGLLREAKEGASQVRKEAREYSQRAREKIDKGEGELRARTAALDKRAAEVIKTEAVAKRKAEEAEAALVRGNALKADYQVRTDKLQRVMQEKE